MNVSAVRPGLAIVASLGIAACAWVAFALWDGAVNIGGWRVALDLGLLAAGTALAFALAGHAPRPLTVAWAAVVLVWGWFGAWAYGFSWVPGLCALVACLLPRGVAARPRAVTQA